MSTNIFRLKRMLPIFLLAESLSFLGWYLTYINTAVFVAIFFATLYVSQKRIEYGLALIFAELLIGSKGYLFWLTIGDFKISIRIAIWLAVMLVWSFNVAYEYYRERSLETLKNQFKIPATMSVVILIGIIVFATLNGIVSGNGLKNVFFDMNAWVYFLLLWPLHSFYDQANIKEKRIFIHVLFASSIWLMIKTWLLLYFFSHDFPIIEDIYRWVRDTGVGEITAMKGGFYRIFIQSHIYSLFAFLIVLIKILSEIKLHSLRELLISKKFIQLIVLAGSFFSVILIGLSRSFWVALVVGSTVLFVYWIIAIRADHRVFRQAVKMSSALISLVSVFVVGLMIIFVIIKFPIPTNLTDFNATTVLSDRATQTTESAIGSRWALLPELWSSITKQPLFGAGFGKTVTYYSSDPRVLQNNPTGEYTTYAFEWGWLDIWLKLGLLGLISYIYLIALQIAQIWHFRGEFKPLSRLSIMTILVTLTTVHIFTPYINHPLGIGMILLAIIFISQPKDLPELLR